MNTPLVEFQESWITPERVNEVEDVTLLVQRGVICEKLRVSKQALSRWVVERSKTGFPPSLLGSEIYHLPDVQDWYERWLEVRPVGGRLPKEKGINPPTKKKRIGMQRDESDGNCRKSRKILAPKTYKTS